jgi:hypothetical protein
MLRCTGRLYEFDFDVGGFAHDHVSSTGRLLYLASLYQSDQAWSSHSLGVPDRIAFGFVVPWQRRTCRHTHIVGFGSILILGFLTSRKWQHVGWRITLLRFPVAARPLIVVARSIGASLCMIIWCGRNRERKGYWEERRGESGSGTISYIPSRSHDMNIEFL